MRWGFGGESTLLCDPVWYAERQMPYHHETYWKTLVDTCLQKRKEQEEAFRKGAAMVGREEREWRQRAETSFTQDDKADVSQLATTERA